MLAMNARTKGETEIHAAPPPIDGATLTRQRDLQMFVFSLSGIGYRRIAIYFGVSVGTVHNRIHGIPPEARERYARRMARNFPAAMEALR